MSRLRFCFSRGKIISVFLICAFIATSLAPAKAAVWSSQDSRKFILVLNETTKFAIRSLAADGWKGIWNTGSKAFDNTASAYLMYRTKAGFENSRFTRGRTKMMIRFTMYKEARNAAGNAEYLNKYYRNISKRSDKNFNYKLTRNENLGFGAKSNLYVVKAMSKFGRKDAPNSSVTRVIAIFVSDQWQIVINEAYNPAAVKAVMLALIEGLGRQNSVDITRSKILPAEPKDTSDEGSVEIKLANPNDAELGNIETNFYEVSGPSGKKLGLMKEPLMRSKVLAALPNGTGDIRIRKLGYVGNRKWASICASSKCGWVIAKYLRQQNQQSRDGINFVEVAFPEAYVFTKPSVNSRKIRSLIGGKRVALKEIITNENGDGWIRICGDGWCGWAGQDFFNRVQ